jgi:hypothetical protein
LNDLFENKFCCRAVMMLQEVPGLKTQMQRFFRSFSNSTLLFQLFFAATQVVTDETSVNYWEDYLTLVLQSCDRNFIPALLPMFVRWLQL